MKKRILWCGAAALLLAAVFWAGYGFGASQSHTPGSADIPAAVQEAPVSGEADALPPPAPSAPPASGASTPESPLSQPEDEPPSLPGKNPGSSSEAMPRQEGNAAATASGALRVEGARLVDGDGRPVQLKGASTHGLAWFPGYVNEACFRELHDRWQMNAVRLAMYTAESGGYCSGGNREELKGLIRSGVEAAARQGMYAIIDWHILSDGNPNLHLEDAKAFFDEMSGEFAGCGHVLYEICNEPNGGTSWADIKAYAEEVIPVIRSHDSDAVILVGTPEWCQRIDEAAADPILGYDNLMYTFHFYAATHKEELRGRLSRALDAGLPVFVSEYGICDASGGGAIDEKQAEQWLDLLDERQVSWVVWNLSNKQETSALFQSSCNKLFGFGEEDLSSSGRWIYRRLTGAVPASALSPDASPSSPASEPPSPSSAAGPGDTAALTQGELELTVTLQESWEAQGETVGRYELSIRNPTDSACGRWEVSIPFEGPFTLIDGWNGDFSAREEVLHISSRDYNGAIPAGGSVSNIGFIAAGAGPAAP